MELLQPKNKMNKIEKARKCLQSLRWKEDMKVKNHFGDFVWLKPLYVKGKRVGITDCCDVKDPCSRHKSMHEHYADSHP